MILMKRLFAFGALLVAGAVTLATLSACNDNSSPTGTGAKTGSISGKVTFKGPWPSKGQVQVSVFSTFPPSGPPDGYTDPIPPEDSLSYNFKIVGLDPGAYAAVLVGWLDPTGTPGMNETCNGVYWMYPDSVGINVQCAPTAPGPIPVTVQAGQNKGGLNITADLSIIP
jgi:hypothetical protein